MPALAREVEPGSGPASEGLQMARSRRSSPLQIGGLGL